MMQAKQSSVGVGSGCNQRGERRHMVGLERKQALQQLTRSHKVETVVRQGKGLPKQLLRLILLTPLLLSKSWQSCASGNVVKSVSPLGSHVGRVATFSPLLPRPARARATATQVKHRARLR